MDSTTIAVIGGSAVTALAAVLTLTDPERRRQLQAEEVGGGDKEMVKDYFNNSGFQRWRKIYGETDDVNRVQRDIRLGHSKTVGNVMKMLNDEGSLKGITGAFPFGRRRGSFKAMRQQHCQSSRSATWKAYKGSIDVLIHYPQHQADKMIGHLASLASSRLILSFAPKTFYYDILKRIGELFPGPSKATRAYLHSEGDVERALRKVGWKIRKRGLATTQFCFARLVEVVPPDLGQN